MLNEDQRQAAAILSRMSDSQRRNAERLGFVVLGLRYVEPSFVSATVDISLELLAEEARLRSEVARAVAFDI